MKSLPILTIVALVVSIFSGYIAFKASSEVSESRINALVDARLAARELKFVQTFAPHFREMFADMANAQYGADWNPTTLEELVAPLVKVTSDMDSNHE